MPPVQTELQSAVPQADEGRAYALFDKFDGFSGLRNGLRRVAAQEKSWAGIPMPIGGHRLVIEPHFPRAKSLAEIGVTDDQREKEKASDAEAEEIGFKVRNRFWSFRRRAEVIIYEENGKIGHFLSRGTHPVTRLLHSMHCSSAWGLEQEHRAVQTLGTLLRHHIFKDYLLTGAFAEKSKRSGLLYVFRRMRPTIVLDTSHGDVRVRCALCMHPIGFYEDTWAGVMTPTDDVIAHLMLMRGDEPMLWRRSNQHPAWRPEAGL